MYAPNDAHTHKLFFHDMESLITDCCMVLGDFNSITESQDHYSGNLDSTSVQLAVLLAKHHLVEPDGPHLSCFSYHHPSLTNRKSRLARIYLNYDTVCIRGYAYHTTFSDHYLVGLFLLKPIDLGP